MAVIITKCMCLQTFKYTHNLSDVGSSLVEKKYHQLHFAPRMAKLQLNAVFLTLSPLTQHCDIPRVSEVTNTVGVLERSSLKISCSQDVKPLEA